MPQLLFKGSTTFSPFTNDNTILIDDSLEKSVCNESGNAIFLKSWSRNEPESNYLLDTLAPWLSCLNTQCMPGFLWEYVDLFEHAVHARILMEVRRSESDTISSVSNG